MLFPRTCHSYISHFILKMLILILSLLLSEIVANTGRNSYRAAVVDYQPFPTNFSNLEKGLMDNVKNMETFIIAAHEQKADIIVFPECGLMASVPIFISVPDPIDKVIPANEPNYHESLRTLSKYAVDNQMYIAVNVFENYTSKGATKRYNTNLVLDRNGTVVARYRKYNLFGEQLDVTTEPELSFFDTDFGVRMGQFICFDILFENPALTLIKKWNVTDFIFPSKWFSELPYLTAAQSQWMWSTGNNVNLLAAGYNELKRGCGGSGIYRGGTQGPSLYQMDGLSGSTLLIADVPIRPSSLNYSTTDYVQTYNVTEGTMKTLIQPELPEFSSKDIDIRESYLVGGDKRRRRFSDTICHNDLCCTIDMIMYIADNATAANDSLLYKMIVYDGRRHFGHMKELGGLQACGVVACTNTSLLSCANVDLQRIRSRNSDLDGQIKFENISIEGNFVKEKASVLPDVFLYPDTVSEKNVMPNFLPVQGTYVFVNNRRDKITHFTLNANRTVITCGIMSRVFSRDGSNNSYQVNSSFTLLVLLSLCSLITIFNAS